MLIVATEHNSVFAFDAEDTNQDSTDVQIWHSGPDLLGVSVPSGTLGQVLTGNDGGCVSMTDRIGITSTPAVALSKTSAPKEGVVFITSKNTEARERLRLQPLRPEPR